MATISAATRALNLRGAAMNARYAPVKAAAAKAAVKTPVRAAVKAQPLTIRQQAINQVNAVNQASMTTANLAATKAINDSKAQAAQALGFQHALADITQGDAGRVYDAYGNAAAKVSAYGDLAVASAGDSSRSAADQAQNYLASVGPDVGAETRPDIAGALQALGATSVGDVAGSLAAQGAYAQERERDVRNAQLMRLDDIGANARYQGVQTANQLRSDEVTRESGSRAADVIAAISALKTEKRATNAEGRAQREDIRAGVLATNTERRAKKEEGRSERADVRAGHEDVRAGVLATNTERRAKEQEGYAKTAESRAADDQYMKDQAFKIELQQKQVDLAASKLANATGTIAKKQAQFDLDHAQQVLDASLKKQAADIAATKAGIGLTRAQTESEKTAEANAKKSGGKKGITAYEKSQAIKQAHDAAASFHDPPAPKSLLDKPKQRMSYKDALPRLMGKYGLTKTEALNVLNVYYQEPGTDGRPVFDDGEIAQLVKLGFTRAQVNQASNGYGKAKRLGQTNPGYALYEKMLDRMAGKPPTLADTGTPGGPSGPPAPMG